MLCPFYFGSLSRCGCAWPKNWQSGCLNFCMAMYLPISTIWSTFLPLERKHVIQYEKCCVFLLEQSYKSRSIMLTNGLKLIQNFKHGVLIFIFIFLACGSLMSIQRAIPSQNLLNLSLSKIKDPRQPQNLKSETLLDFINVDTTRILACMSLRASLTTPGSAFASRDKKQPPFRM